MTDSAHDLAGHAASGPAYRRSERPAWWLRLLGVRYDAGDGDYRTPWGSFAFCRSAKWAAGLWLFEEGYSLHVALWRLSIFLNLPLPAREPHEMCESWGFTTCDGSLHLNWGQRYKVIDSPWATWVRVSQEVRRPDGSWVAYVGTYERDREPDGRHVEAHPYRYLLRSGELQERTATIYVEREIRRRHMLRWTAFGQRVRHYINVEFSDEVGERSGSWKGGTVGCAYEMRPDETPRACLKRMEQERRF